MSFYIKQYRNNGNHWSEIPESAYQLGNIKTEVAYFVNNQYKDTVIEGATDSDTLLKEGETYFLSIDIERIGAGLSSGNSETGNTEKEIIIKLLKDNNSTIFSPDNQHIKTIVLPKKETINGNPINTSSFNFIITPNSDYKKIAFILSRDLTNKNDIDLSANITAINRFVKLKNLIGTEIKVSDSNINITQIGIHARPGTLMCINGEPVKIGKRGVFELNSVFRLQQKTSLNGSQDSAIDIVQSDNVGVYFLNIINLNANNKEITEYYTIDYRYVKVEEAT